jgi:hypothetical protein
VGVSIVRRLRRPVPRCSWIATATHLKVSPGWSWAKALAKEIDVLRCARELPMPQCRRHTFLIPPAREIQCCWHMVPSTPWAILYNVRGEKGEELVLIALVRV